MTGFSTTIIATGCAISALPTISATQTMHPHDQCLLDDTNFPHGLGSPHGFGSELRNSFKTGKLVWSELDHEWKVQTPQDDFYHFNITTSPRLLPESLANKDDEWLSPCANNAVSFQLNENHQVSFIRFHTKHTGDYWGLYEKYY